MKKNTQYISLRKDGRYKISVLVGTQVIVRYAKYEDDAIEIRDSLLIYRNVKEKYVKPGIHGVTSRTKMATAFYSWMQKYQPPHYAISTYRGVRGIYEAYVLCYFAEISIEEIDSEYAQAVIDDLGLTGGWKSSGLSTSTLQRVVYYLKAFFGDCVGAGYVRENPFAGIKYPKNKHRKRGAFTQKEQQILLDHVRRNCYEAWLLLRGYFETGCRREELLAVQWRDVDVKDCSLLIHQVLVYDDSGNIVVQPYPKTKNSNRTVYLSEDLMGRLANYHALHDPKDWDDSFVFHPDKGKFWKPNTVSRYVYARLKKLGLSGGSRHLCLHSTRHTMATRLINEQVPIPTIKMLGGWESAETIFNNYADSNLDDVRDAQKSILFSGNGHGKQGQQGQQAVLEGIK